MSQLSFSKPRTWGTRFDPLPMPSPPSSPTEFTRGTHPPSSVPDSAPGELPGIKKDERTPYDASVFVGSLPAGVDQAELTRLLTNHLSDHAEVKNIKVVRDAKGGICAFIQCDDSSAASRLLQTLHTTTPRPFLGRTLRYEAARAFRTLLISYRAPVKLVSNDDPTKKINLELPYAMRLWKSKNNKTISITYNAEAREVEIFNKRDGNENCDRFASSLFLDPLVFDQKTVESLARVFGTLESFKPFCSAGNLDNQGIEYPSPHSDPRPAGVDTGCWEVKWVHRDDCISALMTLRRVPHLTVTWAHQPNSSGYEHLSPVKYVQRHMQPNQPTFNQPSLRQRSESCSGVLENNVPQGGLISVHASQNKLNSNSFQGNEVESSDKGDHVGGKAPPGPPTPTKKSVLFNNGSIHSASPTRKGRFDRADSEFPPLGSGRQGRKPTKLESVIPSDIKNQEINHTGRLFQPPLVANAPQGVGSCLLDSTEGGCRDAEQEIEIPPTPGLAHSPVTPKTPGSYPPDTPTTCVDEFYNPTIGSGYGKEGLGLPSVRTEKELDPNSVFVGGLEASAWDEERLASTFSKYGKIEGIKFVRPPSGPTAFGFVRFTSTEAPLRAIPAEHNRMYDGRHIRVQIRDCNPPPRMAWKHRGRVRIQQYDPYHRYNDRVPDRSSHTSLNAPNGANESDTNRSLPKYPSLSEQDGKPGMIGIGSPPLGVQGEMTRHASPDTSVATAESSICLDKYREWYDLPPSATLTPPPSSYGSSAVGPTTNLVNPCSRQAWVPQVGYQPPYLVGFPGFAVPFQPMPSAFVSPAGSDNRGPVGPWPPVGFFNPYGTNQGPAPSVKIIPVDETQDQRQTSVCQPPLVPTGFIQGEQGTLIPVYHPEALSRYMSNQPHGIPVQVPNPPAWTQLPQPFPFAYQHPVPNANAAPPIMQGGVQPQPRPGASWASVPPQFIVPAAYQPQPPPPLLAQNPNLQIYQGAQVTKGGGQDQHLNQVRILSPRRLARREHSGHQQNRVRGSRANCFE